MDRPIHLSVVATSRNDNHGGSLTHRMQHFVDGFVAQCKRHDLRAELILVEWNPPVDRVPLAEELRWPKEPGPCEIRIVTVPREVHARFAHADKIPLYQMIAKNVGIRRARGHYVLATNVDILFSDAVIRFMRDRLQSGRLYRAYRVDVPEEVPQADYFAEVLRFCAERGFRIHGIATTVVRADSRWRRQDLLKLDLDARLVYFLHLVRTSLAGSKSSSAASPAQRLWLRRLIRPWAFTNACGDFTLLSREDWHRLRGYVEWDTFSWHLDSLLVFQAVGAGLRQDVLDRKAPIFHIEHGRGYTPEGADELFLRLKDRGIPFVTEGEFLRLQEEIASHPHRVFNETSWGMAAESFPETGPIHA